MTTFDNRDVAFQNIEAGIRRALQARAGIRSSQKPPRPPAKQSANPTARRPSIPSRLHSLLAGPLHSYHLTTNSLGEPMWSYTVLRFETTEKKGVLRAHALHAPKTHVADDRKSRYEYETEASFDHHHLVLHTHCPDVTDDDILIRVFPSAGHNEFPLCGIGFLAHTWYQNPASTISILDEKELECARGAANGESITDPKVMRALQAKWEEAADHLHLARLPLGVKVYRNWDRFPKLLDAIPRDDSDDTDLRIVTFAFKDLGWPEDKITALVKRGLRVKILLTDPDGGEAIVFARNKARQQFDTTTPQSALAAINDQIRRLQDRKEQLVSTCISQST